MPRRKRIRQSEPPSIDDILAGRVENEPLFDIDDLPVDAPAIARPFVPTPLSQVISGEADPDSHGDLGAAADEAPTGFDPAPENVPLPHRAPRTPRRLPTMEEIYNSLRDDPWAAGNYLLRQDQDRFEKEQERRQREGLPPSPDLQYKIDKIKRHLRSNRAPWEFVDHEAELRNRLSNQPEALRDFDLRKALRELDKEMKERRERGLPTLDRHVSERRSLARQLGLTVVSDEFSTPEGLVSINPNNIINLPEISPLRAFIRGGLDNALFSLDDDLSAPILAALYAIPQKNDGRDFGERYWDAYDREMTRQNLEKEEAWRQQPIAYIGGNAASLARKFLLQKMKDGLLKLSGNVISESVRDFLQEQTAHVSPETIGALKTRIRGVRARPGGKLDRELKTLELNLTGDDGLPQTSKLFIKTILQNFEDRRRLSISDPDSIGPTIYRNLLPFLNELRDLAQ